MLLYTGAVIRQLEGEKLLPKEETQNILLHIGGKHGCNNNPLCLISFGRSSVLGLRKTDSSGFMVEEKTFTPAVPCKNPFESIVNRSFSDEYSKK
jgi:hypothetical protein